MIAGQPPGAKNVASGCRPREELATVGGKNSTATAKMTGMTPAMLTRSGM